MTKIPTLHVYGQSQWHGPLVIVGDIDGLEALGSAIVKAMAGGEAEETAFQSDGEGYPIQVIMVEAAVAGRLPCAYEAEHARDTRAYPKAVEAALARLDDVNRLKE